jgi:hypothetical protein
MKILQIALSEFKPLGGFPLERFYAVDGAIKNCDALELSKDGLWVKVIGARKSLADQTLVIPLSNISIMRTEEIKEEPTIKDIPKPVKEAPKPKTTVNKAKATKDGSPSKPTNTRKRKVVKNK